MDTILEKYFGEIYNFIGEAIGDQISPDLSRQLIKLAERAENRMRIEIELREFACQKFAEMLDSQYR